MLQTDVRCYTMYLRYKYLLLKRDVQGLSMQYKPAVTDPFRRLGVVRRLGWDAGTRKHARAECPWAMSYYILSLFESPYEGRAQVEAAQSPCLRMKRMMVSDVTRSSVARAAVQKTGPKSEDE